MFGPRTARWTRPRRLDSLRSSALGRRVMKRARVPKPKAGPFDGYRRREIPRPDPELTEVGPGTPCGEYLRRFWQPVAFARDLMETPLRVRILGEDLVVFRDRGGRVGLLHLHCAHRGTSLEFGIPLERGLRC